MKSITDDIQKRLADRKAEVLREVLGARLAGMTFGELKTILASPLGKPILDLTIGDLLGKTNPAPAAEQMTSSPAPAAKRPRKATKKSSGTKAKARGSAKHAKLAKITKRASTKKRATKSAKPATAKQATKATAKAPRKRAEAAAKTSAAKPSTKKPNKSPATKGERRPRQTPSERKAYEAAIVAALTDAGDWMRTGELRSKVGGNIAQLHYSTRLLVEAGQIERTGERNLTRFKVAVRKPTRVPSDG